MVDVKLKAELLEHRYYWGQRVIEKTRKLDGERVRQTTTGGQGEIRTHGTLARTAVFKTAALNHSATYPEEI